MSKNLKIALGAVGAIVVLLLVLPLFINADQFRPMLESEASKALGRPVTIGKLSLSIFSGQVGADEIVVGEDPAFGKEPFIRAAGFQVGVQVMPLIKDKKLIIDSIELSEPQVSLVQGADMRWNFSSLGGAAKPDEGKSAPAEGGAIDASVGLLRMNNGKLTIKRPGWKPEGLIVEKLNVEARDLSATTQMPVKLTGSLPGGGEFNLDGTAGPVAKPDSAMTPVEAKVNIEKLDLDKIAEANDASALGGVATYAGSLSSKDGMLRLRGQVNIEGLKVGKNAKPATRAIELSYNLTHDIKAHSGTLEESGVKAGAAEARFGGQYSAQGTATTIALSLSGNSMPLDELVGLLPAFGVVLPQGATLKGGALTLASKTQGVTPQVASTGTVTLVNSRLTGYSLSSALTKAASLAGIHVGPDTVIERLSTNFENSPQMTKLSGIQMSVQGLGTMSGGLTIDAGQNLNGQLTAVVKSSGGLAGAGLKKAGGSGESELTVPVTIAGTTSNPQINADASAVAGQVAGAAAKSAVQKALPGEGGKAAGSALGGLLGGKKKR